MVKPITSYFILASFISPVFAEQENFGEDPFLLELQAQKKNTGAQPWKGRSAEEVRAWAKKNAPIKLVAKSIIDVKDHPEWEWFRKSGLGLFIHWGLPSANPHTGDAWATVWNKRKNELGRYAEPAEKMFSVAETWNPDKYDPKKWLSAAKKAGFGYSVLTTRHHDGYALWPSEHGTWDTGDLMDGRDLVKDYVEASRSNDMRIGFYFSGPNWHYDYKNREFTIDKGLDFKVNYKHEFVDKDTKLTPLMQTSSPAERAETVGQVHELMKNYGDIDIMWWDGVIPMKDEELRPLQPNILVARGNIATPEGTHQSVSENVKVTNEAGWWWESCQKSENKWSPNWHYGAECETNHWTTNTLLTELIRCRSLGGNLLVNVPPRGNGEMMDWFYVICDEMSGWMAHSREAIYDVDQDAPLPMLDKTQNFTTKRGDTYYSLPNEKNVIFITDVEKPTSVTILRTGVELKFEYRDESLRINFPEESLTDLPDMVKITFK